jgi:Ca-activated chloride channel family protein
MMDSFRFAYPAVFLLVPLFFIGYWLVRRRAPLVMRYSDTRLLSGLPLSYRVRLRQLPNVLRVCAWFAMLIALARPQFGEERRTLYGNGLDIVFTVDISDSMGTPDFDGQSRLNAAKQVIEAFVKARDKHRFGLVAFSEEAYFLSPPTLDQRFILEILSQLTLATSQGQSSRTAIGQGIVTATQLLRESDTTNKVVILLTDGDNNAGRIDPITAAEVAATLGIRVYTIGMGQTELDEATLRNIAFKTNASYHNALDLASLQSIYEAIDALETSRFDRELNIQWRDQAFIFLQFAFFMLIIERVLRHTIFQTLP